MRVVLILIAAGLLLVEWGGFAKSVGTANVAAAPMHDLVKREASGRLRHSGKADIQVEMYAMSLQRREDVRGDAF